MKQDTQKETLEIIKEIIKTDEDSGKYVNAQKMGRNISIGLAVIVIGILYSFGGITLVATGIAAFIALLFISSAVIYILIKTKVI